MYRICKKLLSTHSFQSNELIDIFYNSSMASPKILATLDTPDPRFARLYVRERGAFYSSQSWLLYCHGDAERADGSHCNRALPSDLRSTSLRLDLLAIPYGCSAYLCLLVIPRGSSDLDLDSQPICTLHEQHRRMKGNHPQRTH